MPYTLTFKHSHFTHTHTQTHTSTGSSLWKSFESHNEAKLVQFMMIANKTHIGNVRVFRFAFTSSMCCACVCLFDLSLKIGRLPSPLVNSNITFSTIEIKIKRNVHTQNLASDQDSIVLGKRAKGRMGWQKRTSYDLSMKNQHWIFIYSAHVQCNAYTQCLLYVSISHYLYALRLAFIPSFVRSFLLLIISHALLVL